MKLVIIGPPGSGKGTQGRALSSILEVPHVSTGDLLRAEIAAGTEIGKTAASLINGGNLVPDELSTGITFKRLEAEDCNKGFVLDGFPRTLKQAENLYHGPWPDAVLSLEIPDLISRQRIPARSSCKACGETFSYKRAFLATNADSEADVCPFCGSKQVYQRPDDTLEALLRRLEIYHREAKEIKDYLGASTIQIDGTKTPDQVTIEILAKLLKRA